MRYDRLLSVLAGKAEAVAYEKFADRVQVMVEAGVGSNPTSICSNLILARRKLFDGLYGSGAS
jgi:hypothetical protein